jgi:hypothetical protein
MEGNPAEPQTPGTPAAVTEHPHDPGLIDIQKGINDPAHVIRLGTRKELQESAIV